MRPIQQQRPNPIFSVTFPILVVFLFSVFTGVLEFVSFFRGIHLLLITGSMGLIAVFVTGRFMRILMSPVGKILTLFTVWFILCIPMAIWRGGSFGVFVNDWSKSFLAYFLTAGLIATVAQERKAFNTIAYSVGTLACLVLALHQYDRTGRLSLVGSRYSNANELGFSLLVGLAFLGFMYSKPRMLKKVTALVLAGPILIALAKTGSRACLLGAAILLVFVFVQASGAIRAKLVLVAPVVFVLLLLVVPAHLRERYTTLFSSQSPSSSEAAGSAESRWVLLQDSLWITMQHPLSGVGPGNFPVAQNNLAVARGEAMGLWRVTHNTYTQLSSEMGVPGLVIYLAFLFQCWKALTTVSRSKDVSSELRAMAKTLRAVFVVLVTVAITDSFAYSVNIPIVAGLATALSFIARDQRAAMKAKRSATSQSTTLPEPEPEPAWNAAIY